MNAEQLKQKHHEIVQLRESLKPLVQQGQEVLSRLAYERDYIGREIKSAARAEAEKPQHTCSDDSRKSCAACAEDAAALRDAYSRGFVDGAGKQREAIAGFWDYPKTGWNDAIAYRIRHTELVKEPDA